MPRKSGTALRLLFPLCLATCLIAGLVACNRTVLPLPVRASLSSSPSLRLTSANSGAPVSLSRKQLFAMQQYSAHLVNDSNFAQGTTVDVHGPRLEDVLATLHLQPSDDLIELMCADGYRGNLTREFIAQHHPILALTVDGQLPEEWAAKRHSYNPGPYFIAYSGFRPSFRVLAHDDYAQAPANITHIHATSAEKAFMQITPPKHSAAIDAGLTIAKQNCLRCHAKGPVGGTKSHYSYADLSQIARDVPRIFASYTRAPKSLNPDARMPPNPQYDQPTLDALTAYFAAFPPTDLEESHKR